MLNAYYELLDIACKIRILELETNPLQVFINFTLKA